MSIFMGKTGLRHQFFKRAFGDFASADSAANAILVARVENAVTMFYIDNTLNTDLALLLVHPDADSAVTGNRLYWLEVPTNRVLNYNTGLSPAIGFDPGTEVWAYNPGSAPASGALRIAMW